MYENKFSLEHKFKRYSFARCLTVIFTAIFSLVIIITCFADYYTVKKATLAATTQLAERMSVVTELSFESVQHPAYDMVSIWSNSELTNAVNLEERLHFFPYIADQLKMFPLINSMFVSYENNDFFSIHSLRNEGDRVFSEAPDNASFLVRNIQHRENSHESDIVLLFYDNNMHLLERRHVHRDSFNRETRDWYITASRSSGIQYTRPYFYFGTGELGVTVVTKVEGKNKMVGVDISLASLSNVLEAQLPTPHSKLALTRSDGSLISHVKGQSPPLQNRKNIVLDLLDASATPVLNRTYQEYLNGKRGLLHNVDIDGEKWSLYIKELEVKSLGEHGDQNENLILLAIPVKEIMKDAQRLFDQNIIIFIIAMAFSLPVIWLISLRIARSLNLLAAQAKQIHHFRFDAMQPFNSRIKEVDVLAKTLEKLKINTQRFLNINQAIISERSFGTLIKYLVKQLMRVANADGGFISLFNEQSQYLPEIELFWHRKKPYSLTVNMIEEILPTIDEAKKNIPIKAVIHRNDPLAKIEAFSSVFANPRVLLLDIIHIPLCNNMNECLGVLTFLKRARTALDKFQDEHISFIRALSDAAAVALENQRLLAGHREFLTALVHIIAGAIDAKSPYTGGHCQRVPVIFQMILETACQASDGPFKDFTQTEDELEEAKLAAWLHDCGKVTTPEYVVDKATKLETIYDRIHEIRMRFEVLKRDAEIQCWKNIASGENKEDCYRRLKEEQDALDNDFLFVAQCNTGTESLDDASIHRLQSIGKRTWMRTIEKRAGVSTNERSLMGAESEELPTSEFLLADKPEHLIPRSEADQGQEYDPSFNFKIAQPELLYNKGEIYNLTIKRGTLSVEERYKINDHIVQTIIMLDKLPLPKNLKNIPEIAGCHHETLDGKGYPRKLTGSETSLKSKMMVIADIFEALTAADRPYKPSKSLSEALKIMKNLKDNNHIDPDLYDLFVKSDIPQKYAKQYLRPEQCDL